MYVYSACVFGHVCYCMHVCAVPVCVQCVCVCAVHVCGYLRSTSGVIPLKLSTCIFPSRQGSSGT